ncbi:MAG TPA: amidohydrolase family protein [Planctomycetota bacterium]|nr:amidohydrolase family protein [Planctomycetota bacterium]
MRFAWCACVLLLAAQDPPKQDPPKSETKPETKDPAPVFIALTGGDIHTAQGVLKGATIVFKDAKIHRIGHDLEIPEGAKVHDVTGRLVLPGFVAATARGLGFSGAGVQKIADSLDPYQETLKLALAGGVTTAYVESGGGMFGERTEGPAGTSAVIKMCYGDLDRMLVVEPAAVNLSSWLRASASQRSDMRETFRKAREMLEKIRDYEARRTAGKLAANESAPSPGSLDSYVRVLRGDIPARISASSAEEIATALALVNEFRFRAVILDADEAWTMAEEIGRARCHCVVTPRRRRPADKRSNRPSGSSIEQAAILRKAGVKFAIVPLAERIDTGGIAGRDLQALALEAAFAVRGGLDAKTALESITLSAAEALGVDSRVGSLEEGKDADVIVLDGDPLDYRTYVELTFVNGKLLYDKSKSPQFSHLKRAR